MSKQVVLVTGGSGGIGKAICMYLQQKGFIVYGTTRKVEKYKDFSDFNLISLDVHNVESIKSAVLSIVKKEGRIDILINNAGIGITGPVEETPEEAIDKVFNTNFKGPLRMIQEVLPVMRSQNSGLIINITSIAGYMGLPFRAFYSASKGALEVVVEGLRMETKQFGVKVVNLAPGDYATNIADSRYTVSASKDSVYKESYQMSLDLMNAHVDSGRNPNEVAKKIFKIIKTKNPKVHYTVGSFMQKFSIFLKKILPNNTFERLLLRHYKL
ncbi:short-chain dehydrogenase/reductase [Croceivirga lutea]|uniref:SDR family oxidoreductase n=1 Tax=Croceivirga lutea TaxID=1775167 RepID=UPI001639AD56|nr:SDR family oxidoreductase [Croceivirga lutea]GGG46634.1 short-chain dehydrogenase/reductase [Croceivirga lutea]